MKPRRTLLTCFVLGVIKLNELKYFILERRNLHVILEKNELGLCCCYAFQLEISFSNMNSTAEIGYSVVQEYFSNTTLKSKDEINITLAG